MSSLTCAAFGDVKLLGRSRACKFKGMSYVGFNVRLNFDHGAAASIGVAKIGNLVKSGDRWGEGSEILMRVAG